jgi:predicted Fe-Mo cluster-binding NifX family protein
MEVVLLAKAAVFVPEGDKPVDGEVLTHFAKCDGYSIYRVATWSNRPSEVINPAASLVRGDAIYTDSLEVFGATHDSVSKYLAKLSNIGIKVCVLSGYGITEITDEMLEIALMVAGIDSYGLLGRMM